MLILVLCQDLLCSLRQATFPFCFPSYKAKEFGLADTYGLPRLTGSLSSCCQSMAISENGRACGSSSRGYQAPPGSSSRARKIPGLEMRWVQGQQESEPGETEAKSHEIGATIRTILDIYGADSKSYEHSPCRVYLIFI